MTDIYNRVLEEAKACEAVLVAVSKRQPHDLIRQMYESGQLDFGENRVQELAEKRSLFPNDIRWHFIGHLQTNKVKYIAPFVHMIHSVDSLKLARKIDQEAKKNDRSIPVLLEIKIAQEESKHGFQTKDLYEILKNGQIFELNNIQISGLMGMATFCQDETIIRTEFKTLKSVFDKLKEEYFKDLHHFKYLSIGMSADYKIALEEGSNMLRIGSLIFGPRQTY